MLKPRERFNLFWMKVLVKVLIKCAENGIKGFREKTSFYKTITFGHMPQRGRKISSKFWAEKFSFVLLFL